MNPSTSGTRNTARLQKKKSKSVTKQKHRSEANNRKTNKSKPTVSGSKKVTYWEDVKTQKWK